VTTAADERAAIVALRRDGLSHRKIAKEVSRNLSTVQAVLKEIAA